MGVNDLDDKGGIEVAEKLTNLTNNILRTYPDVKVILNEVTPRHDERDMEVIECNKPLHTLAKNNNLVFIAKQSNL